MRIHRKLHGHQMCVFFLCYPTTENDLFKCDLRVFIYFTSHTLEDFLHIIAFFFLGGGGGGA